MEISKYSYCCIYNHVNNSWQQCMCFWRKWRNKITKVLFLTWKKIWYIESDHIYIPKISCFPFSLCRMLPKTCASSLRIWNLWSTPIILLARYQRLWWTYNAIRSLASQLANIYCNDDKINKHKHQMIDIRISSTAYKISCKLGKQWRFGLEH